MNNTADFLGKQTAQNFLINRGYKILDKDYCFNIKNHSQPVSIIIAEKGDTIYFIEVKILQSQGFSKLISLQDKTEIFKRIQIREAIQYWLKKHRIPFGSQWRVNVMAVIVNQDLNQAKIKYFKNITRC